MVNIGSTDTSSEITTRLEKEAEALQEKRKALQSLAFNFDEENHKVLMDRTREDIKHFTHKVKSLSSEEID